MLKNINDITLDFKNNHLGDHSDEMIKSLIEKDKLINFELNLEYYFKNLNKI